MLTPILNTLRPDDFMIVNNKSRRVINFFAAQSFKLRLTDYAATNAAGRALVSDMSANIGQVTADNIRPTDLFDMLSHWLFAVQKYPPVVGHTSEGRIRAAEREVVVTVPQDEDHAEAADDAQPETIRLELQESHRIQAAIAKIGSDMGFRIWVPRNDRQKVLTHLPSDSRGNFLEQLPLNYDDVTLKTIEQIDTLG
jgi:hypothetical protein